MSMIFKPKELKDKIEYIPGSVAIKDGVILTEDEQKIFEEFKKYIEFSNQHRSEYIAD